MQRITAVVGSSVRLRDELLQPLLATWGGEIKRAVEPEDVPALLMDLDTPSLFSTPALWVVRCDQAWLKRHAEALAGMVGPGTGLGALVLVAPEVDRRTALAKALDKAGALLDAAGPGDREIHAWTTARLNDHPQGVEEAGQVANLLVEAFGAEVDAILGAIEQIALYADEAPLTPVATRAVVAGIAERPPWEAVAALFEGDARRCLELLHAGHGQAPELLLGAVAADLRRMLACAETKDDIEAARLAGHKGSPFAMRHARRRLQAVGVGNAVRLMNGVAQTWRQLRQGGGDAGVALDCFVLHARRVLRPGAG